MDTDSSQPPPLQLRHTRVRAQKLRMSCDACSNSKIKCDQRRPVCCRCQKLNLKCNYSPSRRMGKPPAASRDLANSVKDWMTKQGKNASKSADDEVESLMRGAQSTPVESISQPDSIFSAMDLPLPAYEDMTSATWQAFMADGGCSSTSEMAMPAPDNLDRDFSWIDTSAISHFTAMESICDALDFDDEFTDPFNSGPRQTQGHANINLALTPEPLPTPPYSGSNDDPVQGYNCTSLASLTLYSLNLDSKTCNSFPTYAQSAIALEPTCSPSSIDQILITNKSAVENVSTILACPCSLSHQSSIILALIIDKIIARYQALIRDDTRSGAFSVSSACATENLLRATPITLGAYRMDAEDEQRIRIQLVSNELRKAMSLVKKHSDRYLAGGCDEGKGEDGAMYATLTSFLRGRLNEAMKETVRALRSSAVK